MLDFAQFEREMTVERTKDKMYQRAKKGLWNGGIVPYGYYRKDKKLIIHKKEAECIKEIFNIFIQTQSLSETIRQINKKYKTRAGKNFIKSTIFGILRNPVYIGKIRYGEEIFEGKHKGIISEVKFLKARMLVKKHIPKTETKIDRNYLLTGLIRCGECGSIMTPSYTKKNKNNGESRYIYYYRCTKTYQYNWNACPIKIVNAEKIENYVIEKLKYISQNNQIITSTIDKINSEEEDRIKDFLDTEKKLKNELSDIEKQIKNIVNTLAEGGIKFNQIKSKLEELENRRKVLESDIEEIKIKIEKEKMIKYDSKLVIDSLKNIAKQIEGAKAEEKKRLLQLTIKEIKYGRQDILINLFYLPAVNNGSKNRSELLPVLNKFRTIPIKVENTIIITKPATQSNNPNTNKFYKGQIPFGYDFIDNELKENPQEQEIIRKIKQMRATGLSLREIARELNKKLIPTKNNGIWQANTIRKILQREKIAT